MVCQLTTHFNSSITHLQADIRRISDLTLTISLNLRTYYCDMTPESRDSEVRADVHCHPAASPSTFPWQLVHKQTDTTDTRNTDHWIKCSVRSVRIIMKGEQFARRKSSHMEAGSNTSLHRNPESRRRRRKVKSRIWDSKIWSRISWDSGQKMTALARTRSNCKRQTRPLVREGTPHQQTPQLSDINKNLVVSPRRVLYSKTDWPTDRLTVGRNIRLRRKRSESEPVCERVSWSAAGKLTSQPQWNRRRS
jgi:hypothetical protein